MNEVWEKQPYQECLRKRIVTADIYRTASSYPGGKPRKTPRLSRTFNARQESFPWSSARRSWADKLAAKGFQPEGSCGQRDS